jgi:hypothetical protein
MVLVFFLQKNHTYLAIVRGRVIFLMQIPSSVHPTDLKPSFVGLFRDHRDEKAAFQGI